MLSYRTKALHVMISYLLLRFIYVLHTGKSCLLIMITNSISYGPCFLIICVKYIKRLEARLRKWREIQYCITLEPNLCCSRSPSRGGNGGSVMWYVKAHEHRASVTCLWSNYCTAITLVRSFTALLLLLQWNSNDWAQVYKL